MKLESSKAVVVLAAASVVGGLCGYLAYRVKNRKSGDMTVYEAVYDDYEDPDILDDEKDRVSDEVSSDAEFPFLSKSSMDEKPPIMEYEVGKHAPRIISVKEYMDADPERQHVATYFVEDEILAGLDQEIDELDPSDIFGGIGDEVMCELKSGSISGLYVMCANQMDVIEIVITHSDYAEEYETAIAAKAEMMAGTLGYSVEETAPVRRRR